MMLIMVMILVRMTMMMVMLMVYIHLECLQQGKGPLSEACNPYLEAFAKQNCINEDDDDDDVDDHDEENYDGDDDDAHQIFVTGTTGGACGETSVMWRRFST